MKTIGIIGGTTWVSTQDYYKSINQRINKALGNYHSARIILYSINFEDVIKFKAEGNDEALKKMMLDAANKLEYAGADCLLLAANTMHMLADFIQQRIKIPLIHIGEETATVIAKDNVKKVGLLGTKTTMEEDFYIDKLKSHNIETIVPGQEEREYINRSIFDEFSKEIFAEDTRIRYGRIIIELEKQGAEGIILGCTEIPLLLKNELFKIPLFNTTEIHADAAVRFVLDN